VRELEACSTYQSLPLSPRVFFESRAHRETFNKYGYKRCHLRCPSGSGGSRTSWSSTFIAIVGYWLFLFPIRSGELGCGDFSPLTVRLKCQYGHLSRRYTNTIAKGNLAYLGRVCSAHRVRARELEPPRFRTKHLRQRQTVSFKSSLLDNTCEILVHSNVGPVIRRSNARWHVPTIPTSEDPFEIQERQSIRG